MIVRGLETLVIDSSRVLDTLARRPPGAPVVA